MTHNCRSGLAGELRFEPRGPRFPQAVIWRRISRRASCQSPPRRRLPCCPPLCKDADLSNFKLELPPYAVQLWTVANRNPEALRKPTRKAIGASSDEVLQTLARHMVWPSALA